LVLNLRTESLRSNVSAVLKGPPYAHAGDPEKVALLQRALLL